jgi:hypothetical protein
MQAVCMAALTTVLGMIPLLADPVLRATAVCIMFGLSFAAVLSLIGTTVRYASFFNIHETGAAPPVAQSTPQPAAETEARPS